MASTEMKSAAVRVYLIHDNEEWIKPFLREMERSKLQVTQWLVGGAESTSESPAKGFGAVGDAIDVASTFLQHLDTLEPPANAVYFNRASMSAHTRGKPLAVPQADRLVRWLASHGRKVVGGVDAGAGASAWDLELNKEAQDNVLAKFGVPLPATAFVHYPSVGVAVGSAEAAEGGMAAASGAGDVRDVSTTDTVTAALPSSQRDAWAASVEAALASLPADAQLVVKPTQGGSGHGVRIFGDANEAREYLLDPAFAASETVDGGLLVQAFVDQGAEADSHMFRLEFVGKKLVYAVRVDTSDVVATARAGNGINNCPADSCQAKVSSAKAAPAADLTAPESFSSFADAPLFAAAALPAGFDMGFGGPAPAEAAPAAVAAAAAPVRFDLADSVGTCPMKVAPAKFVLLPAGEFEAAHSDIVERLEALQRACDIDICGVEVVVDAGGVARVIDMNSVNTNYSDKAEKRANVGPLAKRRKAAEAAGAEVRRGGSESVARMLAAYVAEVAAKAVVDSDSDSDGVPRKAGAYDDGDASSVEFSPRDVTGDLTGEQPTALRMAPIARAVTRAAGAAGRSLSGEDGKRARLEAPAESAFVPSVVEVTA